MTRDPIAVAAAIELIALLAVAAGLTGLLAVSLHEYFRYYRRKG